ncbi:hydroxymethylglutaryl-CoA reductase, degradative [Borreliella burgdorferi]|uniref:hydroxymethylglutaryl-CoA reductase, degradative n=1 Tax=Borreliella burgdorferi TaxID=139 RepID=UPI00017F467A|nr:hydroxymethylglutaryl-CoA reductase, degradative [Borreliella burgdorferi]EEF83790.1 hydroxymethylglutaryl-CoA reductase, degradative [Borreliella burgdorferi CA-11.2A]MCD2387172.1 hydroxymethylglutaryl-CoA reductase, degradative [Borreliella burgdorferi]MCD2390853.1 hydroxymethylglutaryl-CoA reductase, degradative [Borreliella burgdorferi]MCD2416532.1 hydroxymethylglutaryl-CoA reductase, degradative [Borreliella burgdorferi]MCD2418706.1 hydroxymethylglutaryl-CoA reductase, degradative [Bor
MELSKNFRHKSVLEKRQEIKSFLELSYKDFFYNNANEDFLFNMIENYIGYLSFPIGIIKNLKINGKYYSLPIATEESSVVAALNFAAKILENANLKYSLGEVLGISQIYIKSEKDLSKIFVDLGDKIKTWVGPLLTNMNQRGGGFRRLSTRYIKELGIQKLNLYVDTCDAMGANLLNSIAERVAESIFLEFGYECVLKVLSNDISEFAAKARFVLDFKHLLPGKEDSWNLAKKIELISSIGFYEEERAVTNNKGIMNGITGVCLATFNDTRALEASVHKFASKSGKYLPLSKFYTTDNALVGEIEIPLQVGTKGGVISFSEASILSFKIMNVNSKSEFIGILSCVGLASNFAALRALAFNGIQKGHMRLHVNKIFCLLKTKYNISDFEKDKLLFEMERMNIYSFDFAFKILKKIRLENENKV